MTNFLANTFVI